MNWTLNGYKTWTGTVIIGIGAVMQMLGLGNGETVVNTGMVVMGIGGGDKILKQVRPTGG
jgi:hypothetical protein